MSAETERPTGRLSSRERRKQVLDAAVHEFAAHGYHGASTQGIARRAGVSQPYIYALFRDKKALFLQCQEQVVEHIRQTFRTAAGSTHGEEAMARMGPAYRHLLQDRDALLCQLQGYAAAADPDIRAAVSAGYQSLFEEVTELSGAPPARVADFFARGMYLNVVAVLGLPDAHHRPHPPPDHDAAVHH